MLVDRWDRRITIVVVELVRALAFLSVGIAFAIDPEILSVEMIYALIFLESSLQNFFNPARLALMPNLVNEEDLRAGNSLMEVSRHIGFLVAPSAGVVLADYLGASTIIIVDGVTFAISGLTVFMIRWRQPKRIVERAGGWREQLRQVSRETAEGIGVIRAVRLLQVTILLGFSSTWSSRRFKPFSRSTSSKSRNSLRPTSACSRLASSLAFSWARWPRPQFRDGWASAG